MKKICIDMKSDCQTQRDHDYTSKGTEFKVEHISFCLSSGTRGVTTDYRYKSQHTTTNSFLFYNLTFVVVANSSPKMIPHLSRSLLLSRSFRVGLTQLPFNERRTIGHCCSNYVEPDKNRGVGQSSSFHSSTKSSQKITTQWADPAMQQYKFWNREESTEKGKYSYLLEISPESMKREAKILSLSAQNDVANWALHEGSLPMGSKLLGVGESLQDFDAYRDSKPNVLFVSPDCPGAMVELPLVLAALPTIEWVHVRSAGIDFLVSDELTAFRGKVKVTNAKGQFSSSLAEYVCDAAAMDTPNFLFVDINLTKYRSSSDCLGNDGV
jgi:hypothetical protein